MATVGSVRGWEVHTHTHTHLCMYVHMCVSFLLISSPSTLNWETQDRGVEDIISCGHPLPLFSGACGQGLMK